MGATTHHKTAQKPPFAVFFAASFVIFFLSLSAADSVGFVPCFIDDTCESTSQSVALSSLPELGAQAPDTTQDNPAQPHYAVHAIVPERIKIDSINLDLPIQNPGTRDIGALDALLQKGPARYVDSAKLGEEGNIIVFAHSSHLPIVHNQMYKAFNRIPELKAGDSITISGGKSDYLYTVSSVDKVDVSDTTIDISKSQGTKLTLVTCDTLTGKSARFILHADFVGTVGQ